MYYPKDANMRRITSGMWAVRKEAYAGAKQDGGRLLKQIEKQIFFSARCRTGSLRNISVPEVYGIQVSETRISVDMEYIPFSDVKSVMLDRDRATNEWMIESTIDLVDYHLTMSKLQPLSQFMPEFEKKGESIKSSVKRSKLITHSELHTVNYQVDTLLRHFQRLRDINIPIGFCHRDLTLANMLVDPDNRELCVFDFLDCFVVSI
jgi:serine/threonine protein kinase